jgi:hypothetical protein
VLIFLISQLVAQVKFSPYIDPKLDVVETTLTVSLVLLALCGMAFSLRDSLPNLADGKTAHMTWMLLAWVVIIVGVSVTVLGLINETFENMYALYLTWAKVLDVEGGPGNNNDTLRSPQRVVYSRSIKAPTAPLAQGPARCCSLEPGSPDASGLRFKLRKADSIDPYAAARIFYTTAMRRIHRGIVSHPATRTSRKTALRTLLEELSPYIAEGSGVDLLSQKKKAAFWLGLVNLFPNIIDYLCNPKVDPAPMLDTLDEFFQMYISSPEDTAKREVDDRSVGTILFTPIRPEFRGPVACFLASTSAEGRQRYYEVATLACARDASVSFTDKLEQLYAFFSTVGEDTRVFGFGSDVAPTPLSALLTMAKGTHVTHPQRGRGVIRRIDASDARGKPYIVEYSDGARHHYSIAEASSKLRVDVELQVPHSIEGTRVVHSQRGRGVICRVDMSDLRGKPYVVDYSNAEQHRYSLSALVSKFSLDDSDASIAHVQSIPAPSWEGPFYGGSEESPSAVGSGVGGFDGVGVAQPHATSSSVLASNADGTDCAGVGGNDGVGVAQPHAASSSGFASNADGIDSASESPVRALELALQIGVSPWRALQRALYGAAASGGAGGTEPPVTCTTPESPAETVQRCHMVAGHIAPDGISRLPPLPALLYGAAAGGGAVGTEPPVTCATPESPAETAQPSHMVAGHIAPDGIRRLPPPPSLGVRMRPVVHDFVQHAAYSNTIDSAGAGSARVSDTSA